MPSCHPHTLAYHAFNDAEVDAIRSHLLAWYRANRRRLPWRGDAPPYGAAAKQQQQQQQPHNSTDNNSSSNSSSTSSAANTITLSRYFTTSSTNKRHKPSPPPTQPTSPQPPQSAVSAYGVWVSEVMLQQTRVDTVISYYTRWMARFPSLATLAAASLDDVNTVWSGLGYYRRARLLHEAAKHVQSTLHGRLPDTVSGLLNIAGIGPYTAGAIASIAYHRSVPLVDGNVSRVLSRLRALHASPKEAVAVALHWQLAQQLVSGSGSEQSADAGDWNQALMELGAVVCMPRSAECGRCPVRLWCRAAQEVTERRRPVGGEQWRVNRKRVVIEVEVEDKTEVEQADMNERGKEEASSDVVKSNRRAVSGTTQPKQQTSNKHKTISLDHSSCTICNTHTTTPPSTVLDYPSKAVKKPPIDEHVSVCVVSRRRVRGGEVEWLLSRRSTEGLLAGQWEFPCVVHPPPPLASPASSAPTADERCRLLADGLSVLLPTWLAVLLASSASSEWVGELTHVFSHRRHLMHVQRCVVVSAEQSDDVAREGEGSNGRKWRWMSASELTATGLTTGQRKVWALSRGEKVSKATDSNTQGAKRKKRKEMVVEEVKASTEGRGESVDESGDGEGEECDGEEVGEEEEWEVWPTIAQSDGAGVEEVDDVIVID